MTDHEIEFRNHISDLVGKLCYHTDPGTPDMDYLELRFGSSPRASDPSSAQNDHNPMTGYEPDVLRIAIGATWRLVRDKKIVASANDAYRRLGSMAPLLGCTVVSSDIGDSCFDLTIRFDGGYLLEVFSDRVDTDVEGANYIVSWTCFDYCVDAFANLVKRQW